MAGLVQPKKHFILFTDLSLLMFLIKVWRSMLSGPVKSNGTTVTGMAGLVQPKKHFILFTDLSLLMFLIKVWRSMLSHCSFVIQS